MTREMQEHDFQMNLNTFLGKDPNKSDNISTMTVGRISIAQKLFVLVL